MSYIFGREYEGWAAAQRVENDEQIEVDGPPVHPRLLIPMPEAVTMRSADSIVNDANWSAVLMRCMVRSLSSEGHL